jgi:hypothetical protein
VYRCEFPNGQVLAVKMIDSSASMVQNEDDFLSVVEGLSRLQQTNCAELVGYCIEHDQRLLVYEYISRGTLKGSTSRVIIPRVSPGMCTSRLLWEQLVPLSTLALAQILTGLSSHNYFFLLFPSRSFNLEI